MINQEELDAKIDLMRFERHDPRVIVIALGTLTALAEELKSENGHYIGEGTASLTDYGTGKWHWYKKGASGYGAIQCATYKGIPLLHYMGDLEVSPCSDLAKLPNTLVAR